MTTPTLEPLTVIDIHEVNFTPYREDPLYTSLMEWARSSGINPKETYRVEVYLLDCPFARVYEWALDDDGRRYLADDGKDFARGKPYDVILSSFPPVPEETADA